MFAPMKIDGRRVFVSLASMAVATLLVLMMSPGSWILSVALVLAVGAFMLTPADRWHDNGDGL